MKTLLALILVLGVGWAHPEAAYGGNETAIFVVGDSNSTSPNVFATPEVVDNEWPMQLNPVYNGSFAGATVRQAGITINARLRDFPAEPGGILVTGVGLNSVDLESYGGQGYSAAQMIADFEDPVLGVLTIAQREGLRLIVVDLPGPMAGSSRVAAWDADGTRFPQLELWNQYLYDLESAGTIEVIRANAALCVNNRVTAGAWQATDYGGNALHYNQNAHDWIAAALLTKITSADAALVEIDISPFSPNNTVKPASDDPIVVAVYSSDVANGDSANFDALQVNPDTLKFGSGEASNIAMPWVVDADLDGEANDVLYAFKTQASGIICGDTETILTGQTYSGVVFESSGMIAANDCTDLGCHPH